MGARVSALEELGRPPVTVPRLGGHVAGDVWRGELVDRSGPAPATRRECVPDGVGRHAADAREELQHPLQGQLVARVVGEAQVGEHVLDVGLLEEADAAAHHEGDAPARQLELDLHGVVVRPVEDGDLPEREALVAQLEHPLGDEGGLLLDVAAGHEPGQRPGGADAAQLLLELLEVVLDGGVGQVEDLGRGAVVRP